MNADIPTPSKPGNPFSRRDCLWLALIALLTRVLYWIAHSSSVFFNQPLLDQEYYHRFALAILEGGESLRAFGGFRPMLYSGWLAIVYALAGPELGGAVALFLQHGLGIGIALLLASAASHFYKSRRAGWTAGLLYAFAGLPLYFEGELLIVTTLVFLLTLLIVLAQRALDADAKTAPVYWGLMGSVVGLSIQARPNTLLLIPAIALWALFQKKSTLNRASCLSFAAGLILLLALFAELNRLQSGTRQWITSAGGVNFYVGNAGQADGMIPRQSTSAYYSGAYRDSMEVYAEQSYMKVMAEKGVAVVNPSPKDISHFWYQKARNDIAREPGKWIRLLVKKSWLLLWQREVTNNKTYDFILREETPQLHLFPVRWWMLLTLAVPGLWVAGRRNFRFTSLILLMALSYAASIVLFFINARFRLPLWPFAVFFASGAFELLRPEERAAWSPRLRAKVGLLSLLVLLLSAGNWGRVPAPTHERDYYFRSVAALRQGLAESALADVDRALALDPEYLDARFHRANILFAIERFDEAAEAYRIYTLLDPAEQRGWGNLGMALLRSGKPEAAAAAFNQAITLAPEDPGPWVNLLLSEIRQARYDSADEVLSRMPPRVRELDVVRAAKALLDAYQNRNAAAPREEWTRLDQHSPNVTGYILHFLELNSFPPALNP